MSSTGQTTSSTDNIQLIIGALADYAKKTGIDLSNNPFAAKLKQSGSSDDILQLLGEREKAFNQYRDGDRSLINFLTPVVKVLYGFSGILSGAVGPVSRQGIILWAFQYDPCQVPFSPAFALFVGLDILLGVRLSGSPSKVPL